MGETGPCCLKKINTFKNKQTPLKINNISRIQYTYDMDLKSKYENIEKKIF